MSKYTSKLLVCFNTQPSYLKSFLGKKGLEFVLVNDYTFKVPEKQKNKVYGFTSITGLASNLPYLKKAPILWETISVINQLKLNYPIVTVDSKILTDGIVHFIPLNKVLLKKHLTKKFKNKIDFVVEKRKPVQFGNNSKLSLLLNSFVSTLPEYIHESLFVALTSSFKEKDFSIFNSFIKENRVITDFNKKQYKKLADYIKFLEQPINCLIDKDLKELAKYRKNKEVKESLSRVRFFLQYFGNFKLDDYMDDEKNISNSL